MSSFTNANGNVNRTTRNERDPLILRNDTNVYVSVHDEDDDFEDIIQGERNIPAIVQDHRRSVTNAGTFFHLLKATFSPALLTMPKAISHLGLVPGIIGIFIFGVLFTYCIHILFRVNRAIVNRVALDRMEMDRKLQQSNASEQLASSSSGTINSVPEGKNRKDTCTGIQKTLKRNLNIQEWELQYAQDIEIGEASSTHTKEFEESYASCYETIPDDNSENNGNKTNQTEKIIEENKEQNIPPELPPVRTIPYHQLIRLSFHYGNDKFKWMAKPLRLLVLLFINLIHYGCCCICFLFTAESLGELATKGPFRHSNSFQMVSYAVPFVICISFLPVGYEMTAVNTIAFLMQFLGVCMMGYFFVIGEHCNHTDLYIYSAPVETWYLYFGLIFYAFEGTDVCLHIESHMARKSDFLGWKGVLSRCMYVTIPVYAIVGGLGYWKYGNDVYTSVTFNLPEEQTPDNIQMLIGMGVLLTYPFHLSFLINPLRKLLLDESLEEPTYQICDGVLRAIFVVSTYVISALVPYLELQLTVLGATASCVLILVMPAFMSLNNHNLDGLNYSTCRRAFHWVILIIGLVGSSLGSYLNFKNAPLYYPNSTVVH